MKNILRFVFAVGVALALVNAAFASAIVVPGENFKAIYAKNAGTTYVARPTNKFEEKILHSLIDHSVAESDKHGLVAIIDYSYINHPEGDFILIKADCDLSKPNATVSVHSRIGLKAIVSATNDIKKLCLLRDLEL
ncbi:MAG: hypothetical protein WCG01_01940 [bacterium]